MPLPASQRNFPSDCLRISPHRTVSFRIPLRQAPGISLHPSPHRIASSRIPLRQAAWNQLLSFPAPRCLVPNPVPHDLLLRPASSLVMLGLVLRFLQFASFRWPESNSAVFRYARCIMLAKTLRPLNIYGTCACAYLYIRADGNQKAAASLVPCGEGEAGGGLVGRDGSRVWDGGQICHHFFLGFSGAMLYSSRMMSS